jgi:Flp pilus assembly protein TadG
MDWRNMQRRFRHMLRALVRRVEGATAVEFAIIAPVIGVLMLGTVDLALLSNQGINLDGALRAGAGYAMADPTNETAITNYIQSYAACPGGTSGAKGCFPAGQPVVSFCGPGTGCPAPTDTFAPPLYCSCDNGASISCNSDTSNGGAVCPTGPKHFYVRIQAVWSGLSWVLPLTGVALPSSCGSANSICRTLTVRVWRG